MVEQAFGKVLKALRQERRISQEKLAEYTDLDRTYISLLERSLRQPTLPTIFKIASALKITASELVRQVEMVSQ
jgi:transcriptional regulator with XRE-family HTH domain